MPVTTLEPPYVGLSPAAQLCPHLGSVLVADLSEGIAALATAIAAHARAPWCPLVLRLPDRLLSAATLAAFEPVPGTWAPLYPDDAPHLPPAERVLKAVRRRPIPDAATLARWVALRLRRPALVGTLTACLGCGAECHRPARTLTRRVRALGPLEVRDWRGLGGLARLVAGASTGVSLETEAYLANLDPRTLRRWLRLATDLAWPAVCRRPGWEWLLESALRRAGLFYRPAPAPAIREEVEVGVG